MTPAATFLSTVEMSAALAVEALVDLHQLFVLGLEQEVVVAQLAGHAVEGLDQHAELVVGGDVDAMVEVALGHAARALGQRLDRDGDAARQVEPDPRRGEQEDERHHQDEEDVARLDVGLLHLELAIVLVRGHQAVGLAGDVGVEHGAGHHHRRLAVAFAQRRWRRG